MSTDELWALHEEIASRLAASLLAEKRVLENRLKQLKGGVEAERENSPTGRRPYPTVVPKFRKSGSAVRDVGGTRKDAALADGEIEIRQADRRLPYQAGGIADLLLVAMRASSRLPGLKSRQMFRQYRQ
jgi:hypothetical protein